MPKGSPFTALCQQAARLAGPRRADLHVHTTASDGAFTASQVVAFAHVAKLKAVAITDHDTLAGLREARTTAAGLPGSGVEVVPAVEITTTYAGRELHLLAYFVRDDHPGLTAALERACAGRRERFRGFLAALAEQGVEVPAEYGRSAEAASASLGRPHVADLLVRVGAARTRYGAWQKYVGPLSATVRREDRPTVEASIAFVHEAGGVSSLAHPPADLDDADFAHLKDAGLDALEVNYPWGRTSPAVRLREVAGRLGFLTTGGSDCHGPDSPHRRVGSHGVTSDELERLRERATVPAG